MPDRQDRLGDMPVDDFRAFGREVVDWIAHYFERIEEFPVLSQVEPGGLKRNLPASPPESAEDFADALADVDKLYPPLLTGIIQIFRRKEISVSAPFGKTSHRCPTAGFLKASSSKNNSASALNMRLPKPATTAQT
jgi:hypothetical protein